jgi:glycosyltransferase involved in cell wall biosynthesis
MRIGIDISQIVYETGVSVYTKNLVENLLKVDSKDEFILFAGSLRQIKNLKFKIKGFEGNFKDRIFPIPPTLASFFWNKLHVLPIETLIGKIDVFHSSDWTQPPAAAFKVTTIHDLAPLLFPGATKKDALRDIVKTHIARLYWVKKEADRVIAVSEAAKADVVNYLKVPEEKVRVVYEAPAAPFMVRQKEEVQKVKRKHRIFGNYLLAVGTGPRKNHPNLFKSWREIKTKHDLKLVVAGQGRVEEGRGIVHIRNFSQIELSCLYSGACALVYPSLYEGFGLPILEAFACGCPVVTSNTSAMPEIAGGAAVLVDPNDTDSIVEGVRQAIKSRDKLAKKGFFRVKDFSWEKCARETLKIYKEATSSV